MITVINQDRTGKQIPDLSKVIIKASQFPVIEAELERLEQKLNIKEAS